MLASDCPTNGHGMVKHKSVSAEEHDVRNLQNTRTALCSFFLRDVGHIIQHFVVLAESQINASMTHRPLKCDRGMLWLHISNAADGLRQEHTWLFGHR